MKGDPEDNILPGFWVAKHYRWAKKRFAGVPRGTLASHED